MTGKRFGYLTVSGLSARVGSKRELYWACICDCGNLAVCRGADLRKNTTKSCGCYRREQAGQVGKARKKRPYEALYNRLEKLNRGRWPIKLTYEEFVEFTKIKSCEYCGNAVYWTESNTAMNGSKYNLDRKDNDKGYTKDNLIVCCTKCNYGKSDRYTKNQWQQLVWFMQTETDIFGEW